MKESLELLNSMPTSTLDQIIQHKPESICNLMDESIFNDDYISEFKKIALKNNLYEYFYAISNYYKPESILEIGVRLGYSFISMILGNPSMLYAKGIDNQSYHTDSMQRAKNNIEKILPDFSYYELFSANSQTLVSLDRNFDLIHIDGDHSYNGCFHDMRLCYKYAKVLIIDDYHSIDSVREACNHFVQIHEKEIKNKFVVPSLNGILVLEIQ